MNNEKFGEIDIIKGLLNPEKTSYELSAFLKSKGLFEISGKRIVLSNVGEQILNVFKNLVVDIINNPVEKSEGFIDITENTQLSELIFFPGDKKNNSSIILELNQYYNVFTIGDLMKSKLIGFSFLKDDETKKAFMCFLGELGKLGFIKDLGINK